jgi:8-amino-7-oxononanoate synthase
LLRQLKSPVTGIDFCSNDYLGLAKSGEFNQAVQKSIAYKDSGATGSRLLSGNYLGYEELEQDIAQFHDAPAALIYPSGYQANIGLLQCIAQKGDTLILDELAHASLIDGARLSHAKRYKFSHNNLSDLRKKLERASGNVFVVIESVYSMNGDIADILSTSQLCKEFNAHLIIDEAHSGAIYGSKGQGLSVELEIHQDVFARIITYGKGFGTHGAAILGDHSLISYLINFSRPFIYSTGLSPIHLESIRLAYIYVKQSDSGRKKLFENIQYFKSKIKNQTKWLSSDSAIQSLIIPGNHHVKVISKQLNQNGFSVFPILSPTVAVDTERIRFCIHSYNSIEEIDSLFHILDRVL